MEIKTYLKWFTTYPVNITTFPLYKLYTEMKQNALFQISIIYPTYFRWLLYKFSPKNIPKGQRWSYADWIVGFYRQKNSTAFTPVGSMLLTIFRMKKSFFVSKYQVVCPKELLPCPSLQFIMLNRLLL